MPHIQLTRGLTEPWAHSCQPVGRSGGAPQALRRPRRTIAHPTIAHTTRGPTPSNRMGPRGAPPYRGAPTHRGAAPLPRARCVHVRRVSTTTVSTTAVSTMQHSLHQDAHPRQIKLIVRARWLACACAAAVPTPTSWPKRIRWWLANPCTHAQGQAVRMP